MVTHLISKGQISGEDLWWIRAVKLCYAMGWTIETIKNMSVEEIEKVTAVLGGINETQPISSNQEKRELR